MGPQTHLFAERDRLQGLKWEHFDVQQLSPTVGAELIGLDLTQELPQQVIDEIQQALWDYKVIFSEINQSLQNSMLTLPAGLGVRDPPVSTSQYRNARTGQIRKK